jgi:hypothetical protein
MIGTIRDALTALGLFGVIISAAAGFTVLLASLGVGERKESPIDTQFRAACTQVNGVAVWNGKHWECLK